MASLALHLFIKLAEFLNFSSDEFLQVSGRWPLVTGYWPEARSK